MTCVLILNLTGSTVVPPEVKFFITFLLLTGLHFGFGSSQIDSKFYSLEDDSSNILWDLSTEMFRFSPQTPLKISSSLFEGRYFHSPLKFLSSSSSSMGWISFPNPLKDVYQDIQLYHELKILLDLTEVELIFEDEPMFWNWDLRFMNFELLTRSVNMLERQVIDLYYYPKFPTCQWWTWKFKIEDFQDYTSFHSPSSHFLIQSKKANAWGLLSKCWV